MGGCISNGPPRGSSIPPLATVQRAPAPKVLGKALKRYDEVMVRSVKEALRKEQERTGGGARGRWVVGGEGGG